jgi:glycosyltransferase involved in cell wall biosynthesis
LTRRIPVLFRAETTDIAIERGALKAAVRRAVLRRLYARFRGLLAIGKNSYQHYLDCGVAKEKLWLAPYCVSTAPFACGEEDRERLRGAVRRELETPDDAAVFLFSGKLSKRKGPAVLLEAVRRLQDEVRRKCAVWFLGDGAERQALEEQGRGMACRFLGFRNQTELSRYYHGADVMSLPSVLSETWGLVVNEALHHGLPAVVSDGVGSAADLIERGVTGDVAAAGSVEELAGALERTLTLAGRADIREACRRKMEGYTVRRAAEGIAQAFTSLNGGGRG